MNGNCHLMRSAYLVFGLLTLVELLVASLMKGPTGLLVLGLLLALQMVLLWSSQQVSRLLSQHTQLRQAYENELRLHHEALDSFGHGLTLIDGDGRIRYANQVCRNMTGYSVQQLKGKWPRDFGISSVSLPLPQYESGWHHTQVRCADGNLLNVIIKGHPYWQHGRIVGHLASIVPVEGEPHRELN